MEPVSGHSLDARPLEQSWDTTASTPFGLTEQHPLVATSSTLAIPHFEFDPLDDGEDMDVDVTAMVHEFNVFDATSRLPTAAHAGNSLVMQLNLKEDAQSVAQGALATDGILPQHSFVLRHGGAIGTSVSTTAPSMWYTPASAISSNVVAASTGGDAKVAQTNMSAAGETVHTSDMLSGSSAPTIPAQSDAELSEMNEETKKLIKWVEYFIRQHGGRVIGANLGSALASSNGPMYRTIKAKFGGLTPMLTRFPDHFVLENDPPFNHVSLTDSHFATAYKLMVLEAGLSKQAGASPAVKKTPEELEAEFVRHTAAILMDAPARTLKAVELANVLRARMGTDSLAMIRESHGGLLALLEKHTAMFRVDRIPKNDSVTLQASDAQLLELNVEDVRRDAQAPGASRSYESGTIPETWTSSLAIPSRCLHVGNVAVSMTEDKLRQQFGAYGRIESLKLVSQKGRRFAFVNYMSVPEAEAAKNALSKVHMWRSNISFAKRETIAVAGVESELSEETPAHMLAYGRLRNLTPSRHLWVGCLSNVTKSKLLEIFSEFGEVEDIHFLKDRRCAFVDFVNEEDCIMAYRMMHRRKVGDSIIELGFGRPRESESLNFEQIWESEEPVLNRATTAAASGARVQVPLASASSGMGSRQPQPQSSMASFNLSRPQAQAGFVTGTARNSTLSGSENPSGASGAVLPAGRLPASSMSWASKVAAPLSVAATNTLSTSMLSTPGATSSLKPVAVDVTKVGGQLQASKTSSDAVRSNAGLSGPPPAPATAESSASMPSYARTSGPQFAPSTVPITVSMWHTNMETGMSHHGGLGVHDIVSSGAYAKTVPRPAVAASESEIHDDKSTRTVLQPPRGSTTFDSAGALYAQASSGGPTQERAPMHYSGPEGPPGLLASGIRLGVDQGSLLEPAGPSRRDSRGFPASGTSGPFYPTSSYHYQEPPHFTAARFSPAPFHAGTSSVTGMGPTRHSTGSYGDAWHAPPASAYPAGSRGTSMLAPSMWQPASAMPLRYDGYDHQHGLGAWGYDGSAGVSQHHSARPDARDTLVSAAVLASSQAPSVTPPAAMASDGISKFEHQAVPAWSSHSQIPGYPHPRDSGPAHAFWGHPPATPQHPTYFSASSAGRAPADARGDSSHYYPTRAAVSGSAFGGRDGGYGYDSRGTQPAPKEDSSAFITAPAVRDDAGGFSAPARYAAVSDTVPATASSDAAQLAQADIASAAAALGMALMSPIDLWPVWPPADSVLLDVLTSLISRHGGRVSIHRLSDDVTAVFKFPRRALPASVAKFLTTYRAASVAADGTVELHAAY